MEGPQQVLREVETSGATRTREGIVNRALRLHVGQPVNLEEWSLARKRLFDTNVFRAVDIQAAPMGDPVDGQQDVRAVVTVEEYPHWRLRYGLQGDREREDPIGGEEERRISTGWAGLPRSGTRTCSAARSRAASPGWSRRTSSAATCSSRTPASSACRCGPSCPRTGAARIWTGPTCTRKWASVLNSGGAGVAASRITYGYRFERTHIYDPEPFEDDPRPLSIFTNLGRVTTAFLVDRRDDPVNSLRGTFSSVSFEQSAPALGGDSRYHQAPGPAVCVLPLGRVVLASRVIAGDAFGADVPVAGSQHRFYAGGGNSVRGYAEDALGPQDVLFGEALGGTSMLVLNQEMRFPIYRWIRGVGFLDAGNVFRPEAPFAWNELKVGYGLGVRIDSPVGLLRLDFGIPGSTLEATSRRANDFASGRWYFGIGHVF